MIMTRNVAPSDVARYVYTGTAFTVGQLVGVPEEVEDAGELPQGLAERYYADHVIYTLTSYGTPIAWRTADHRWVLPEFDLEGPSSKVHQTLVMGAALADAR